MPDENWKRVADYLAARRVELMDGDTRRSKFLRAQGAVDFERIASDLEGAVRDNYDAGSIARAEMIYAWSPGSVRAILNGGEPTPKDATSSAFVSDTGPVDRKNSDTTEADIMDAIKAMREDIRLMNERLIELGKAPDENS